MTIKTRELIENKGYKLYRVRFNDVTKANVYYFKPDILKNNHYELILEKKIKNNEYTLYQIIVDDKGKQYESYLIEGIKNTNTFKKMIKNLL